MKRGDRYRLIIDNVDLHEVRRGSSHKSLDKLARSLSRLVRIPIYIVDTYDAKRAVNAWGYDNGRISWTGINQWFVESRFVPNDTRIRKLANRSLVSND